MHGGEEALLAVIAQWGLQSQEQSTSAYQSLREGGAAEKGCYLQALLVVFSDARPSFNPTSSCDMVLIGLAALRNGTFRDSLPFCGWEGDIEQRRAAACIMPCSSCASRGTCLAPANSRLLH